MTIRPATPEDLEAIRSILDHPVSRVFSPEQSDMEEGDLETCHVAETTDGVVGFCRLESTNGDGYRLVILVHPEHHGKGLGSRLLTETLAARAPTGSKVSVSVAPHNGAALAFFMDHGFVHVGRTEAADVLERTLA